MDIAVQIEALAQLERVRVNVLDRTWPLLVIALGFGLTAIWISFLAYKIVGLLKLACKELLVLLTLGVITSILIIGFALGYGVRAAISYRHRSDALRHRNIY